MSQADNTSAISELLGRGVEDVVVREDLEKKLRSGKKLRVKFGVDATGTRLHIGHALPYWKLRAFQELGHEVVVLIGDYTATIGDASDKEAERQQLKLAEVKANMKGYLEQIGKIVDLKKARVYYNSEGLSKLGLLDVLELASQFTVAQMVERDNFAKRLNAGKPVGLQEFMYPLMQGYDSVALKADVELGGSEQLFNMMAGRILQKHFGQTPQNVMTIELLVGADGKKMSKTQPNCVFIDDDPLEMFGKIMTINDELIPHYFKLATDIPIDQIEQIEKDMAMGDNPRDTKASLARHIVARYHSEKAAVEAETAWNKQFREGNQPDEIKQHKLKLPANILDVIADVFGISKSEARRLVTQKGVKYAGKLVDKPETELKNAGILQVGKRRYAEILKK
jgi:tyrosyl-tRNA synthetase